MIDKPEKFWYRLNAWIKQEGINLHKFSKLAGINYSSLNNPHERNSIPGPEILVKIAEFTGLTMEYFLTGKEPWTGKILEPNTARLMEDVAEAPDETQARIKAIIEADRAMLEAKKKKGAEGAMLESRKVGNR